MLIEKSPIVWHKLTGQSVANIKRRIESLTPLSFKVFQANERPEKVPQRKASPEPSLQPDEHEDPTDEGTSVGGGEALASPSACLFCTCLFSDDDEGLTSNLEHMSTEHGLFIPDQDNVNDLQSFIGYLATEIKAWHECLYCGATKSSTFAIQSHMRDKGHCRLNFDREPDLLKFWQFSPLLKAAALASVEQAVLGASPETEVFLDSGRVIGSRHAGPSQNRSSKQRQPHSVSPTQRIWPSTVEQGPHSVQPQPSSSRQLSRREEMGIQGISVQQRQALVLAEKKAQRSEVMARRAREWVYAKGTNMQEFDQIDTKGKWGKQNHKLLPR